MWRWIPLLFLAVALPVLGLLLLALFLWWLLRQRDKQAEQRPFEIEIEPIPAELEVELDLPGGQVVMPDLEGDLVDVEAEAAEPEIELPEIPELEVKAPDSVETRGLSVGIESLEPPQEPTKPDDLKMIEGIGPKIASVLGDAGITTFAQLATTEVGRLQEILEASDPRLLRLADPSSWPEQAQVAAGDPDGLEALKATLKRGRRTG